MLVPRQMVLLLCRTYVGLLCSVHRLGLVAGTDLGGRHPLLSTNGCTRVCCARREVNGRGRGNADERGEGDQALNHREEGEDRVEDAAGPSSDPTPRACPGFIPCKLSAS
jgi:hypothetical protein